MPALAWSTDIHLDHAAPESVAGYHRALGAVAGSVLLVTGDISTATRLTRDLEALAIAARRPVFFVLGNHDHYGGGVSDVRDQVIALEARGAPAHWMPPLGVVPLDDDIAMIGVDGWADGRFGDPLATPLVLNDDRLIAEIARQSSRLAKLAVKRALADADAARLGTLLKRAAKAARTIVVATHVPPFVEALPTRGRLSDPRWYPLLTCGATGTVLREFATAHPGHDLLVLAGHTHAATDVRVLPNLRCVVGGARYGSPTVNTVRVPSS